MLRSAPDTAATSRDSPKSNPSLQAPLPHRRAWWAASGRKLSPRSGSMTRGSRAA